MKASSVIKGVAIGLAAGAVIGGTAHQVIQSRGRQVKRTAMRVKKATHNAAETFMDDMGM